MERGPKTARGKPPLCKGRVLDTWIPYMTAFESSVIKTDCRHLLQRKDMCMENTKQTGCPYHSNGMGGCAAEKFMAGLKLAAIETHVADARTCCLHPASATHRQMNDAELVAAGVEPDLVRLSCGLEDAEDLIADIKQALE